MAKSTEPKLTSQQLANKKQNAKRATLPRLSPFYLSEDDAQLLDELAKEYGSKKAAVIAGLHALKNTINE